MDTQKGFIRIVHCLDAVLVAMLSVAGVFSGCSTSRVSPGPTVADTVIKSGVTTFDAAAGVFAADLKASAEITPHDGLLATVAAIKAFNSGLAMLDLQCDRYLDAIGGANQTASNERKQVGLIGGFTSAIMGLTGSSAKQIAGISTSFSFASSSIDTFTTAYLFSDAASSVTKIVRESQVAWLTPLFGEGGIKDLNYSGAVALLSRYESLCRPAQIRALIDQSIAKGTVVAITAQSSDSEVKSVLMALNIALKRPLTELDAINLYAWYKFPAERENGPKLSSNEPIAALLKDDFSAVELERRLAQAFLSISITGSPVPARWDQALQALRKVAVMPTSPASASAALPAPTASPVLDTIGGTSPSPVPMIQLRMPSLTIR